MRFIVDAQLPPALARWLAKAGHEAEHVADVGLGNAKDSAIWTHALRTGAAIVTKDEDFVIRAAMEPNGPPLFGCASATHASRRCGNGSNLCFRPS